MNNIKIDNLKNIKKGVIKFKKPLVQIILFEDTEIIATSGLNNAWDPNLETERIWEN